MNPHKTPPDLESSWPSASILIWGTFGAKTPEGRRYHTRCIVTLALMVVGTFATGLFANVHHRAWWIVPALLPGLAFAVIFWEFRRYINSLDELARRLQLEAILATYVTGMILGAVWGGIALVYGMSWQINPGWIILLEPVRGGWLYVIARRY